jgi:hypothetical protein
MIKKAFIKKICLLTFFTIPLHAHSEEVRHNESLWQSIISFFNYKNAPDSEHVKFEATFNSINYLTLPIWKDDHKRWGWSTNIMFQLFESGYYSQKVADTLTKIENKTSQIALDASDLRVVQEAIWGHWLTGGLIILGSKDFLSRYCDDILKSNIFELEDKEFVVKLNRLTTDSINQGPFSKDTHTDKLYTFIYTNLIENTEDLFVVRQDQSLARLKRFFLRDLVGLFKKRAFDPLLDYNSSVIAYDLGIALNEKEITSSDYSYVVIRQIYQMLSDDDQSMFRVFLNVSNKDAINDFAFNLIFFSGLVDIGWNADIAFVRSNVDKALGTTVILNGIEAFSINQDFKESLAGIIKKVIVESVN